MTTKITEQPDPVELDDIKRIGAREARNNLADLIGQVHYGGQPVIIERSGKPMVALVPVTVLEQYLRQRATEFQRVEALLRTIPSYPPEEVEQDIAEAIAAVRAERAVLKP
jgi:prevent-host-death family protein